MISEAQEFVSMTPFSRMVRGEIRNRGSRKQPTSEK